MVSIQLPALLSSSTVASSRFSEEGKIQKGKAMPLASWRLSDSSPHLFQSSSRFTAGPGWVPGVDGSGQLAEDA